MHFWMYKKEHEPACLANYNEEQRYLILLARYFFLSLLRQVVKMKTDYDHIDSPEQGGIDTPSYYKTPSHAQFKDPYMTFVLSIKGTWQRGVNKEQFRTLIEILKRQAIEEQEVVSNSAWTPSEERFKKWVAKKFPKLTLKNFDLTDKKMFHEVYTHCNKAPSLVEYFLSRCVLTQVGYSAEQFTSTPIHLLEGFKTGVLYSATPLPKLANPKALKAIKRDVVFEAQVLAQSSKPKNQNFVFPETIADFFDHISKNRDQYAHVRRMIDVGGLLSHEANHEVASKWLNSSDFDGVIYFKTAAAGTKKNLFSA